MKSTTKKVEDCSPREKCIFYELLQVDFMGVNFDTFLKDFNEKQFVMILSDDNGLAVGFSTLMEFKLPHPYGNVLVIFSGDTAVLKEHRDSFGFGYELSKFFYRSMSLYPRCEIYYVLITKGWKTYKVLPFYFNTFFPCFEREITPYEKSLVDAFGYYKYPDNYNSKNGLICFYGETERLRPESLDACIPSRNNPHIDYFFKRNPTYLEGSELVSLARVSEENLTKVVPKLISIGNKTNLMT